MSLPAFREKLNIAPETVTFDDTMAIIKEGYEFTETAFSNGELQVRAGQSNGSCQIFAFGLLNELTELQTLHCFGDYYRDDVLGHPDGDSHQNIRNFIKHGWQGIRFAGLALIAK